MIRWAIGISRLRYAQRYVLYARYGYQTDVETPAPCPVRTDVITARLCNLGQHGSPVAVGFGEHGQTFLVAGGVLDHQFQLLDGCAQRFGMYAKFVAVNDTHVAGVYLKSGLREGRDVGRGVGEAVPLGSCQAGQTNGQQGHGRDNCDEHGQGLAQRFCWHGLATRHFGGQTHGMIHSHACHAETQFAAGRALLQLETG